jgi:multiple sugar transport system ATP-binding protein
MAFLRLNRIYKVYPNGVKAVNDFSIDIENKEFIVFVGPSGCGKSTTLRMIAGLEEITAGELFMDDKLVNDVEPEDRDIAMVFQNYALYPHMTVYDNMAFGLRNRKVKEDVIREKIQGAVKILDLEDYLRTKPREMSGGQRQRVALGRAIVRNPKVFLFDEPLSNLDAKLRASMRSEITKLHKKLETTFIYVTHDQVEAMTMGTRIVVMKDGYVQQIDAPMDLYYKPNNKFVAGFIGTPQMNFFDVVLKRDKDDVIFKFKHNASYKIPYEKVAKLEEKYLDGKTVVTLGVRPEHFMIVKKKTGLSLAINVLERLGNEVIVYGDFEENVQDFKMSDDTKSIIIKAPEETVVEVGDVINLTIKSGRFHLFDKETGESILKEMPTINTLKAEVKNGKFLCLTLKQNSRQRSLG